MLLLLLSGHGSYPALTSFPTLYAINRDPFPLLLSHNNRELTGPLSFPLTVEPILNGTIAGPALNATILGDSAVDTLTVNETVTTPLIEIWGRTTPDNVSFFAQATGIGSPGKQFARVVCIYSHPLSYRPPPWCPAASCLGNQHQRISPLLKSVSGPGIGYGSINFPDD